MTNGGGGGGGGRGNMKGEEGRFQKIRLLAVQGEEQREMEERGR